MAFENVERSGEFSVDRLDRMLAPYGPPRRVSERVLNDDVGRFGDHGDDGCVGGGDMHEAMRAALAATDSKEDPAPGGFDAIHATTARAAGAVTTSAGAATTSAGAATTGAATQASPTHGRQTDDGSACPICYEGLFDNMCSPCGHAVCGKCFEKMVDDVAKKTRRFHYKSPPPSVEIIELTCPTCRFNACAPVYVHSTTLEKTVRALRHAEQMAHVTRKFPADLALPEWDVAKAMTWGQSETHLTCRAALRFLLGLVKKNIAKTPCVVIGDDALSHCSARGVEIISAIFDLTGPCYRVIANDMAARGFTLNRFRTSAGLSGSMVLVITWPATFSTENGPRSNLLMSGDGQHCFSYAGELTGPSAAAWWPMAPQQGARPVAEAATEALQQEAPAPHQEAPAPHQEAPAPHQEAPAPHQETPAPQQEVAPRQKAEAPSDNQEAPAPQLEDIDSSFLDEPAIDSKHKAEKPKAKTAAAAQKRVVRKASAPPSGPTEDGAEEPVEKKKPAAKKKVVASDAEDSTETGPAEKKKPATKKKPAPRTAVAQAVEKIEGEAEAPAKKKTPSRAATKSPS